METYSTKDGMKWEIVHVIPPIPVREWDWRIGKAEWDLGDPQFFGPTRASVIAQAEAYVKEEAEADTRYSS